MSQHYDDDGEDSVEGPILLNAVVTWFRVYQVPFDYKVADVLCTVAFSLYSQGLGGRQIADYLVENYNGPMATLATAPSSSSHH